VFSSWHSLPAAVREHEGVIGSIGSNGDVLQEDINGGFSLWTGRLLREFCDYTVTSYERNGDELASVRLARQAAVGNSHVAISDMTLLYRWVRDARVPFFNTNRLIRDDVGRAHYIDHNFAMGEGLGVRFGMTFGRKKVLWRDGKAELVTRDGETVVADLLHLVGRYKAMASDLEQKNHLRLMIKSAYLRGGRAGRVALTAAASAWNSGPA
jgi:hypothetical protein